MESLNTPSESEQMYLVSMARLAEMADECPIPVTQVADLLGVTSISANQMIHRLEEMGLVTYTPYKGVEFTDQGWQSAAKILQIRRLWEVFLVEKLGYAPQEAETLACRLEHAIPEETAQRLAVFLGRPAVSPQGKVIPQMETPGSLRPGTPLSQQPANSRCMIATVQAGEEERAFLRASGANVGDEVYVLASQQDGACLIEGGNGITLSISSELSSLILVKPESST
jgi:DtxR family transcriptional regulator, Mn-dependent transcriptional regulator